jgi:hypothetical protein
MSAFKTFLLASLLTALCGCDQKAILKPEQTLVLQSMYFGFLIAEKGGTRTDLTNCFNVFIAGGSPADWFLTNREALNRK